MTRKRMFLDLTYMSVLCRNSLPSEKNEVILHFSILLHWDMTYSLCFPSTIQQYYTNCIFSLHSIFHYIVFYYMFRPYVVIFRYYLFVQSPWHWILLSLHWPVFTCGDNVNVCVCSIVKICFISNKIVID
jgi:hypothetical protein